MSGSYTVKVYVVQQYDRHGIPGEVIAVKLTHSAAHFIAKVNAPAKVLFVIADKTLSENVVGSDVSQSNET